MRVIGIDPGKSGAIALIKNGELDWVFDCPTFKSNTGKSQYDEREMAQMLHGAGLFLNPNDKIIIEKIHAMPGQGVTSMFSMGMGLGLWLGIVTTLKTPYELITPQRWKRDMLRDIPGTDQKARAIIAAKRLFPGFDCKKTQHGRAEAVLIAAWGLRHA